MGKSVGVGIGYVKNKNGKLIKRRAPAANLDDDIPYTRNEAGELVPYEGEIYVRDETGELVPEVSLTPSPPRFTEEDRKRDRYTRGKWGKRLRAISEGREKITRDQFQALLAYGRFKGWDQKRSKR